MSVERTESGCFMKDDPVLGTLVFSPYSGGVFAIAPGHRVELRDWLRGKGPAPAPEYADALGHGWTHVSGPPRFPTSHLLPSPRDWAKGVMTPAEPVVINWFLTGDCPMHCAYCYAEDLMRNQVKPLERPSLLDIAKGIIRRNPLAVVLTGGEPLASPRLFEAVAILSGKTGLVIDTNGLLLTDEHLELFRANGVTVRVSLDSERPSVNGKYRSRKIPAWKSGESERTSVTRHAVEALTRCQDWGVSVGVQSVATKESINDLRSLGDKLFRLGVRSWRIHRVAASRGSAEGFMIARCGDKAYAHALEEIQDSVTSNWSRSILVETARNDIRNSVLLVGPDGVYYTESNVAGFPGKVVVDPQRPKSPTRQAIANSLDMAAHAARYLNTSSEGR
jgi:sulfatase maturation enzyme AslB (radical SAM superfamily)